MGVPVEVVVTRYRCPTCRRGWSKRKAAQQHIDWLCPHDPASRSCLTCKNFHEGSNGGYDEGQRDPSCDAGLTVDSPLPRRCPSWTPQPWHVPVDDGGSVDGSRS